MARFGWNPDRPDPRDTPYRVLHPGLKLIKAVTRPTTVDLRGPNFPAIFDQGQVGSCVGNGVARVCGFAEGMEGNGATIFSRLFIYYNARRGDHTEQSDAGTTIRGGIKAVADYGACVEDPYWPYVETQWSIPPSPTAYTEAAHRGIGLLYARLDGLNDMLDCLAQGFPIVFGATLYPAFESLTAQHNIVPLPKLTETPVGGHCMVIVGYDTRCKRFTVANSWGVGWGDKGYCRFPFAYLTDTNLADDFWTVRKIDK